MKYTKELYLEKGSRDYLGHLVTEDRYIMVDEYNMDVSGYHMTLEEVENEVNYFNS